jgi:hypothetical protein
MIQVTVDERKREFGHGDDGHKSKMVDEKCCVQIAVDSLTILNDATWLGKKPES